MAKIKPKFPLVTESIRANLFHQLGQMAKAGLSAEKGLDIIQSTHPKLAKSIGYFKAHIAAWGVPRSGYMAGLFSSFDQYCLQVAEQTGRFDQIFFYLADFYTGIVQRKKQMIGQMIYPVVLVVAALVLAPLPSLVLGKITMASYMAGLLTNFSILAAILWLFFNITRIARAGILPGFRVLVDQLQVELPGVSRWYYRRVMFHFFTHLHLLYSAGVPIIQAWKKSSELVANSAVRRPLLKAHQDLEKGASFSQVVQALPSLDPVLRQFLQTGDESGSLDSLLNHFIQMESEQLAADDKLIAQWIPRILYFVVALWFVSQIFAMSSTTQVAL